MIHPFRHGSGETESDLHVNNGGKAMATQLTAHRSSSGKKLYSVRYAKGRFKDIQRGSQSERKKN